MQYGHILGKLVKKTVKYIKILTRQGQGGGGAGLSPPTKFFVTTTNYVVSRHIDHSEMGVMVILRLTWEL